jgi:hypothetical protein
VLKSIAAAVLLLAATADAGTIWLRSGSLTFDHVLMGGSTVQLVGNHGFSFEGGAQNAFLQAADCAFECDIGEKYSLGMIVSGNDLPGVAELGTHDFVDVGGLSSLNQLTLTFSGEATVPRGKLVDSKKVQREPVTVGGIFTHDGPGGPFPPVTDTLTGKATAIVTWVEYEGGGSRSIARLRYVITR